MCWQAHRGYPYLRSTLLSRRSSADDPQPTLPYLREHVISTRKQAQNNKKPFLKNRDFRCQYTSRSTADLQFCTCRISETTKAPALKLCSIKVHHTTTPQKKFECFSSFRLAGIELDTLTNFTKITEKRGAGRTLRFCFPYISSSTQYIQNLARAYLKGFSKTKCVG